MSDADDTGRGDWSAPGSSGPDQQDTAWVERAPTAPVGPDPDTVVLGDQPTLVDPALIPPPAPPSPAPPAAAPPAWGPPSGPALGQQAWTGTALPGVAGWGAVPLAPKPGVIPLRPLGLGEILDGSISYIRRDPRTVLGISAMIAIVVAAAQFVATYLWGSASLDSMFATTAPTAQQTADDIASLTGSTVVPSLVTWVLQVVATGMLTVVMGQAVLGRRVTIAQAWERTKPRIWALFGVTLLIGLVVGGALVGGVALAVLVGLGLGSAGEAGYGVLVGVTLGAAAIVVAIWLGTVFLLAPSALVLERAGVVMAVRRSARLVKGAWWRTFFVYALASILATIISSILSFPLGLLAGVAPFVFGEDFLALALASATALGTLLTSMITLPFLAGVTSLLYIDRRIRREALDLELQRAAGSGA